MESKTEIFVRKATIKDLKGILRLNLDLFKKEYKDFDKSLDLNWPLREGTDYFKNRIEKDGFVEVAEKNGKIIGYLCGGLCERISYRKPAKCAELENMYIDKKFRNKGLGFIMAKDFLEWCKVKKVNYVSARASAQNKLGIKFYRNFGLEDYDLILEKKIK
jgi:GNAT superfamily N-acetyltransferase